MINKLIDIHLNGDIDLQRIEKDKYDIMFNPIIKDVYYNYAFLKDSNVDIESIIKDVKEELIKLDRTPAIYVLSKTNSKIESDNLEINYTDSWMVLDKIQEYTTNFNIKYSRVTKEELQEFVDTFMINFSSDDPNEPYHELEDGYRKTFTDNFEEHNGFKTVYYCGKIDNKMVCTAMGIYKDDTIILYSGSVNKELRGKGIFKEFLNYITKDLKELGIENICLQTEKGYYPEKLYSKMGFKEIIQGTLYNIK